jgi:DNA-binding transcriptional LysR family regulator
MRSAPRDPMNLNRLAYFATVVEAGSFTRTAERLGVTTERQTSRHASVRPLPSRQGQPLHRAVVPFTIG